MTLHISLPGSGHRHQADQQNEVREARRLLKERIRTDWDYPTLPAWRSSGKHTARRDTEAEHVTEEDNVAGFRFHKSSGEGARRHAGGGGGPLGLDFDPVEWREREYSSDESGVDGEAAAIVTPTSGTKSKSGSMYRFDSPDSVGTELSERRKARKRRRIRALEEEMAWNDGLTLWTRRRDQWCCARSAADIEQSRSSGGSGSSSNNSNHISEDERRTGSHSASAGTSPRTSTSSTGEAADPEASDAPADPESTPASSPSTTPDPHQAHSTPTLPPLNLLIPLAPRLLPNHPVRKRISPNMYPEIYSKIILQSRTPSIPLNLHTLMRALVQGWKDDGEWPPKNAPPERSIGRKKGGGGGGGGGSTGGGLREGVKAVGRVLRLTGVGETSKTHNI